MVNPGDTARPWGGEKRDYMLRANPHPGRYEGGHIIDEYVGDAIGEFGGGIGNVDELGWYADQWEFDKDTITEIKKRAMAERDAMTDDEQQFLRDMAGAITTTDSQGFIDVTYFETKDELDKAWGKLEDEESKFYEGQGDDEVRPRVGRRIRRHRSGPGKGWHRQPKRHAKAARKGHARRRRR